MAGRADIKAGGAFIELFVKDGKFKQQIAGARSTFTSLATGVAVIGAGIAAAGAAILTPLAAAVKHFADTGGALHDMSQRTGLSAARLAFLNFAAEQTGARIEDIETALKHAAKQGFSPEHFADLGKQVAAIEDPAKRTARAMELFGKSGTMLLPMFAELDDLQKRWDKLGIGPSAESVALADELGDAWTDLKSALSAIVFEIGAALAPAVKELAAVIIPLIPEITKWIKANPQLVTGLAALGAAMAVAGPAIATVAGALASFVVLISALLAGGELLAIAGAITFVTAVVLSLTIAWWKFTGIWDRGVKLIMSGMRPLLALVQKTFKGIGDAIKAGDMQLAWEIALTGMAVAWHRFAQQIFRTIQKINTALVTTFGGTLGAMILGDELSISSLAGEAARGAGLDAKLAESKLKQLGLKAGRGAASQVAAGGSHGGIPATAGGAVIGTNAFASLRGAGVIGAHSPMHETMKKILAMDEKVEKHLADIKRKPPPRFR